MKTKKINRLSTKLQIMYKPLILIVLLLSSSFGVLDVFSIDTGEEQEQYVILPNEANEEKPRQLAINYIPFKEIATIMIDRADGTITKSYSLMSKDKDDFQIPDSLESKILNEEKIKSIVYTNMEKCAVGVTQISSTSAGTFLYPTCIMINIPLEKIEGVGFKEKQKVAREIGDSVIDDINQILGTYAKYHSTPLGTSDDSSSEGPIFNVVYTMHHLSAKLLFNMLILENITEEIRTAGGFFNNAKELTKDKNSVFTFSMSPETKGMLYAVHISVTDSGKIGLGNLSPLTLFTEDELNRSKLFAEGFYPLNSIINILIISEEKLQVLKTSSDIIGSASNSEEMLKSGWYYIKSEQLKDSEINKLDLRYLFGNTSSVSKQQLLLSISPVVEDVILNDVPLNDVPLNDVPLNGGGCLIATATFGSEMTPQVQLLRELRDNTVLQTESGTSFMTGFNQFYYSFSPAVADYERENPAFKETVKLALTPMLTSLAILNYVDIDSEAEMLGYGIGIILLNIVMYFVAPAIIIIKIKNRN